MEGQISQKIKAIDFNSQIFKGFKNGEIIMLDSCIIFAYINEHDKWHHTVSGLLEDYILNDDLNDKFAFYTTSCAVNEVVFLINNKLEGYINQHQAEYYDVDEYEVNRIKEETLMAFRTLIEDDLIGIEDGDKKSVLNQMELKELDPADALHISIANRNHRNFLTVDKRLKNKIIRNYSSNLENIETIYYTTSKNTI